MHKVENVKDITITYTEVIFDSIVDATVNL